MASDNQVKIGYQGGSQMRSITASRPITRSACNPGIAYPHIYFANISGEATYRLEIDPAEEDQVTEGGGRKRNIVGRQ
jgi:hypothetical protein